MADVRKQYPVLVEEASLVSRAMIKVRSVRHGTARYGTVRHGTAVMLMLSLLLVV